MPETQIPRPAGFLRPADLVARWRETMGLEISEKTLRNWRALGKGPAFLKVSGRVIYRRADVEAWETENLR